MLTDKREAPKESAQATEGLSWLKIDRNTSIKLGLVAALGVILLLAARTVKDPGHGLPLQKTITSATGADLVSSTEELVSYQIFLEEKLGTTLSQIRGAGRVLVQLSVNGGNRHSFATNLQEETRVIQETAESGNTRISEEKKNDVQLVMAREGGTERPIMTDQAFPQVTGALVVASGATAPGIKEELSQAVQILLGLPAHKVKVIERVD